jgi:hypothetical protein
MPKHQKSSSRTMHGAVSESEPRFEVVISDYTASVEEWRRAHEAPDSNLPELDPDQRRIAHLFGMTEEAYARSVLAGSYGQERMRNRARALGQLLNGMAHDILAGSEVDSVIADMFRGIWLVGLRTASGGTTIEVPRELADDALDSGQESEYGKLASLVRSGLRPFNSVQK